MPAERARNLDDPIAAYVLEVAPATTPILRKAPGVPVNVVTEISAPAPIPDPTPAPRSDAGAVGADPGPPLLEVPVNCRLLSVGVYDPESDVSDSLYDAIVQWAGEKNYQE